MGSEAEAWTRLSRDELFGLFRRLGALADDAEAWDLRRPAPPLRPPLPSLWDLTGEDGLARDALESLWWQPNDEAGHDLIRDLLRDCLVSVDDVERMGAVLWELEREGADDDSVLPPLLLHSPFVSPLAAQACLSLLRLRTTNPHFAVRLLADLRATEALVPDEELVDLFAQLDAKVADLLESPFTRAAVRRNLNSTALRTSRLEEVVHGLFVTALKKEEEEEEGEPGSPPGVGEGMSRGEPGSPQFVQHACGHQCAPSRSESEASDVAARLSRSMQRDGEQVARSPLLLPQASGWSRQVHRSVELSGPRGTKTQRTEIVYRTPCGLSLRDLDEVEAFLRRTGSGLLPEAFCADVKVDPSACAQPPDPAHLLTRDCSQGLESPPISVVNEVDEEGPPEVEYTVKRESFIRTLAGVELIEETCEGCDCAGDCADQAACACRQATADRANRLTVTQKGPTELGYRAGRLEKQLKGGVVECGPACPCSKACPNRLVQRPSGYPLQVFRTAEKGWGVRALVDVPKGAFVATYAGALLSDEAADALGPGRDTYFASLDPSHTLHRPTPAKKPRRCGRPPKRPRLEEEEVPAGKGPEEGKDKAGEQAAEEGEEAAGDGPLVVDAGVRGNVTRWLNHSCEPNLWAQGVEVEARGAGLGRLAFFALRRVRAGEELTWHYGYQVGSVPGSAILCRCGTPRCQGRIL